MSRLPKLYQKTDVWFGNPFEPISPEDFLRLCDADELAYFRAIITVLEGMK